MMVAQAFAAVGISNVCASICNGPKARSDNVWPRPLCCIRRQNLKFHELTKICVFIIGGRIL